MGFMVYSLLWVMQGLYHQPYVWVLLRVPLRALEGFFTDSGYVCGDLAFRVYGSGFNEGLWDFAGLGCSDVMAYNMSLTCYRSPLPNFQATVLRKVSESSIALSSSKQQP